MRELNAHLTKQELTHHMFTYNAHVVDVYDGDSFTAIVDLGFYTQMKIKFRLMGVDTPELRGDTIEEGRQVRDIVRSMILGRTVIIKTEKDKKEKYGRMLAEVFIDSVNLNWWLLENGHAKKYPAE